MLGDLPPHGQHPLLVAHRVLAHRLELVEVEDYHQVVGQRVLERPIERLEPRGAELVVRVRLVVAEGMEVDPDVVESRLLDEPEILLLKSPLLTVLPDGIVAQDVHAPAQTPVLGKGVARLGVG